MVTGVVRILFCAWIFLFVSPALSAIDDYVVKQWSTRDGLPSQSIKSIVQDQQGYIWLGTQFGLSRFDGQQFTNFNTQNSSFINSNAVFKLLVDRFGMLWVGTRRGLIRLNPQTLEHQHFKVKGPIHDLIEDKRGGIWIAANSLYYISANKLTLAQNQIDNTKLDVTKINQIVGKVTKMALAPDGLWLVNERHVLKISESQSMGNRAVRLELSSRVPLPKQLSQTSIHDLNWIDGKLFLATELGAYFLDLDDVLRPTTKGNREAVYKFVRDKEGGVWISTYGRLYYRYRGGSKTEQISTNKLQRQSIWFADIFLDNQGNIWLASFNEGLWFAHPGKVGRRKILDDQEQKGEEKKDVEQRIDAIAISPAGEKWIATPDGLGTLSDNNSFNLLIPAESLGNASINDIEFFRDMIILGTSNGARVFQNGNLYNLSFPKLRDNSVFAISPSNKGGVWLGTDNGLYRYNYNNLTPFSYNAFLGSDKVTYIIEMPRYGFIGTNKGAYKYDDRGIEKIGVQTSLETAHVTSILHIEGITTIVGSRNDGLYYRAQNGDWFQLDAANGLPYGLIRSLHYDKLNDLIWASTSKSVYRMPLNQFTKKIDNLQVEEVITPFDRQLNGEPSQCCTGEGNDAVIELDEVILYPSSQGLVEIPKSVRLDGENELVARLENMSTGLNDYNASQLKSALKLSTTERDLTIQYTSIDFYSPQSIEFRYRLIGHDAKWRYAQKRREAIYTNLPPGQFEFQLQVKRQGQDWVQAAETSLELTLPRRFDETVYFRLIMTCGFIFLFYLIFWVFRAQERRKQAALEALVAERTTELRKANEKLNQANTQLKLVSHSDELTGLRSRRFLFDQLPKDVEHYQRNSQSLQNQNKSLVLMILNIDNFSKVNDAYGPIGGDSCLQQVATLLNKRTQGSDYVARWSGDEFLLLLRDFSRDHIESYVRELCKAIAETEFNLPNGHIAKLTVSLGWSFYPLPLLGGQVIGWEASVNLADIALHQVKQRGGDGAANIIFDDQLDAFEFEQSSNIEAQLELLQSNGLADINIWMR